MLGMTDNEDRVVKLLAGIYKQLGGRDVSITQNINQDEDPESTWTTTGPDGVTVDAEWTEISLGEPVITVNIRFDDDIDFAPIPPYNNSAAITPLTTPNDSPLSIGEAANPIATDTLYVRRADSAATDPTVHVIAHGSM